MADEIVVAPAVEAADVEEAPRVYNTMDEIFNEILDRSGLDAFADVKRSAQVVWEDPSGKRMVIKLTEFDADKKIVLAPCPLDDGKTVVAGIFHDADEVRVYTLPAKGGMVHPSCYCLSKKGRTYVADELLNIEVFIDAMADELKSLGIAADLIDPDDDDDDDDDDKEPTTETSKEVVVEAAAETIST